MLSDNYTLTPRERVLYKQASFEENCLWHRFLQNYPIRFYRQKAIGQYIADFYCFKARLVIEIDGNSILPKNQDILTKTLEKHDLIVLRFQNTQINQSFETICMEIDQAVQNRL